MDTPERSATASRLRSALAVARRRRRDAVLVLEDLEPLWLHPPMDEDTVSSLFDAKWSALQAAELPSEEPFQIPFSVSGLYFVSGPYTTTDAQPLDVPTPPDRSFYYRVHYYWDEPAPNQQAPPTPHIETKEAVWRVIIDEEEGVVVASGLKYEGVLYDSISDLVEKNQHPDGRLREMVMNTETWDETQEAIAEFRRASAREEELEKQLASSADIVDLVVVLSDAARTVFQRENFVMPPGMPGTTVAHFLDRIGVRPPESARVFIGAFELVNVDMDYQEFRRRVSERVQPAKILIVAPPQMTAVSSMMSRQASAGPKMLHIVAAEIPLAVALLPDSKGLVLLYYDSGERLCDHVYPFDVGALTAEQLRTGHACPKCGD